MIKGFHENRPKTTRLITRLIDEIRDGDVENISEEIKKIMCYRTKPLGSDKEISWIKSIPLK